MHNASTFTTCWFLTGATATGKTGVAVELAERLGSEIISMDSMAIYRGMDIGTAKPTAAQRATVPHHLLDIRDPHDEFSVAEYLEEATETVARIRAAGRQTLFVGGTPLYLKALLRGLDKVPEPDPIFRRQVEQEIRHLEPHELHRRVGHVDPVAASQIHPNDTKRLIRVLEVYKQTGEPLSHFQETFEEPRKPAAARVFTLRRPRAELHTRINCRVEGMFRRGLVAEVQALLQKGEPPGRTARQAVGYREVLDHLAGQTSLEDAVGKTKVRTRRFARRQETWFRSLHECRFVDLQGESTAGAVADEILRMAASAE